MTNFFAAMKCVTMFFVVGKAPQNSSIKLKGKLSWKGEIRGENPVRTEKFTMFNTGFNIPSTTINNNFKLVFMSKYGDNTLKLTLEFQVGYRPIIWYNFYEVSILFTTESIRPINMIKGTWFPI